MSYQIKIKRETCILKRMGKGSGIMNTKKQDKKRIWISWILWIAVILILARVMGGGSQVIAVTIEEDGLSLLSEAGTDFRFGWEEVKDLELREEWDYGTKVEGVDNGEEKSGTWENTELGEYMLLVNADIRSVILCGMENGENLVFNFESEESTASLYRAMLEKLEEYKDSVLE